jgi:hypothetical protein
LRWEKVPGAKEYVIEIAEDPSFDEVVKRKRVPHAAYRFIPPSTDISYYFRVAAVDDVGRIGRFSQPKPIQQVFPAPAITGPPDGTVINHVGPQPSVTLAWKAIADASSYRVTVATSRDFAGATDRTVTSNSSAFQPEKLGTYFWRVVALDKTGVPGRRSATRSFEVRLGAPRLSRPPARAMVAYEEPVTQVALRWTAGPADRFDIQTADKPRFRKPETLTSKRPSATLEVSEPGTIFWRVRGIHADKPGPWSPTGEFTVQAASLVLEKPAAGAEIYTTTDTASVELGWSEAAEAKSYTVRIESGKNEPITIKTEEAKTAVDLPPANHTWRVTAYGARRKLVAFSADGAFTVSRRLPPPPVTAPTAGQSFVLAALGSPEIELTWQAVEGASGYVVEVGATEKLDDPERRSTSSERINLWAARAGDTFWRVRAANGLWSDTRKLTIEPRARTATVATNPKPDGRVGLTVTLADESGAKVPGIPLEGSTTAGALSGFDDVGDGTYTATWSGAKEARVSVTGPFGLATSAEVRRAITTLFAGVRVGVLTNFTADASPRVAAQASYLLPLLERRLFVTGIVGYAYSSKSFDDVVEVGALLHRFPITIGGGYRHPLPWLEAYGTLGLALDPFVGTVTVDGTPFDSESGVVLGVDVAAGASWRLGPGRISGELALRASSSWDGLFALGGIGIVAGVGYSFAVLKE